MTSACTGDQLHPMPRLADPSRCGKPTRKVYTEEDMASWLESEAYGRITLFVHRLNEVAKGKRVDQVGHVSEPVRRLMETLEELDSWIEQIPSRQGPQRFGNLAFRDWGKRLEERANALHESMLPPRYHPLIPVLLPHFLLAFGHPIRLDYGTGHELSFVIWLMTLSLFYTEPPHSPSVSTAPSVNDSVTVSTPTALPPQEFLGPSDEPALVLVVFDSYLKLVRRLQLVYRLEPAGSRGVYGLDDHQFLSYVWGSAQLIDQHDFTPLSALRASSPSSPESSKAAPYLYLTSLSHIHRLKSGAPFAEHSPLLHQIGTTVKSWDKVNKGLLKMWDDEVLKRKVVVQHIVFDVRDPKGPEDADYGDSGEVLPWRRRGTGELLPSSGEGKEDGQDGQMSAHDLDLAAPWKTSTTSSMPTGAPWALPVQTATSRPTATSRAPWSGSST